jgi:hypothetical protein
VRIFRTRFSLWPGRFPTHDPGIGSIALEQFVFHGIHGGYDDESAHDARLQREIQRLPQLHAVKHRLESMADRNRWLFLVGRVFRRQSRQSDNEGSTGKKRKTIEPDAQHLGCGCSHERVSQQSERQREQTAAKQAQRVLLEEMLENAMIPEG